METYIKPGVYIKEIDFSTFIPNTFQIVDGYIVCEKCSGVNIFIYSKGLLKCEICEGSGRRHPTWTEYIKYKSELKDCEFNKKILEFE